MSVCHICCERHTHISQYVFFNTGYTITVTPVRSYKVRSDFRLKYNGLSNLAQIENNFPLRVITMIVQYSSALASSDRSAVQQSPRFIDMIAFYGSAHISRHDGKSETIFDPQSQDTAHENGHSEKSVYTYAHKYLLVDLFVYLRRNVHNDRIVDRHRLHLTISFI